MNWFSMCTGTSLLGSPGETPTPSLDLEPAPLGLAGRRTGNRHGQDGTVGSPLNASRIHELEALWHPGWRRPADGPWNAGRRVAGYRPQFSALRVRLRSRHPSPAA